MNKNVWFGILHDQLMIEKICLVPFQGNRTPVKSVRALALVRYKKPAGSSYKRCRKKRAAFEGYMIKAGAHSLAAVQSIHAIPDILAHTIYFGAGQNLEKHALPDAEINLPSVVVVLKRDKIFYYLAKSLAAVQSGDGWRHLAAVSNMSKHRTVVRSALNGDLTTRDTPRISQEIWGVSLVA